MKKFLSMLLAVMLLLSVSSVAMADTTYTDMSEVTITKNYQLIGAGSSPAETFTLQQTAKNKRTGETSEVPDLGTITGAQFGAGAATTTGATANITINLPRYTSVGVYEYTLREVATNQTAGVTYYGSDIYLVVTVINDGEGKLRVAAVHTEAKNSNGGFDSIVSGTSPKSDTFTNTYTAGSLQVNKTVDGILGDKTKDFTFTVSLSAPSGKSWTPAVTIKKNGADTELTLASDNTFTTTLKNGESFEICNLPAGVTYTVSETADTNYTTKINGTASTASDGKHSTSGTIAVTTSANGTTSVNTVSYVNTRTGTVDTGVSLDSLPYLLMLAVAGAGLVLMIARKRRVQD